MPPPRRSSGLWCRAMPTSSTIHVLQLLRELLAFVLLSYTVLIGALLLAGGGDGSCGRAVDAAQCMLRHMGAEYLGYAASLNTDNLPAAKDQRALTEVRQLAKEVRKQVLYLKEDE